LRFVLTEGQANDNRGARLLTKSLPAAKMLLADAAYDSNWLRDRLKCRGIAACIKPTRKRPKPIPYSKETYKQRHRIENAFAKLKDWRRIATRYDRCPDIFASAIALAMSVIFYLKE